MLPSITPKRMLSLLFLSRLVLIHQHNTSPNFHNNLKYLVYLHLKATEYDIHRRTKLRLCLFAYIYQYLHLLPTMMFDRDIYR